MNGDFNEILATNNFNNLKKRVFKGVFPKFYEEHLERELQRKQSSASKKTPMKNSFFQIIEILGRQNLIEVSIH